ncbi:hypothetical protein BLA29_006052 [Euroglyphus maynei]|uniref:Uncharacterized protein n=1 Tax=Euroglyphus maynei TaxID=6958 RepID=A0A1Y3BCH5_EURMA|nr:hypothetical protein BLA29_006052 [Euroglyphus maynei]
MKVSTTTNTWWQSHHNHHHIATLLSIKCTPDPIAKNHCLEFPEEKFTYTKKKFIYKIHGFLGEGWEVMNE